MIVTLTAEQEKFVAERVTGGKYSSPEIIISEGLRLVQAKEEYQQRLDHLRAEIDIGLQQIKRGEGLDGRQVIERILEKNRLRPRGQ